VKRRPVHGVGAGKLAGHYHPVNIGPRAAAFHEALIVEATQAFEAVKKRQVKVKRSNQSDTYIDFILKRMAQEEGGRGNSHNISHN
jgi:hypothetical protein